MVPSHRALVLSRLVLGLMAASVVAISCGEEVEPPPGLEPAPDAASSDTENAPPAANPAVARPADPAKAVDERRFRLRYDFRNQPSVHYRVVETWRMLQQKGTEQDLVSSAVEIDKHFRVISVEDDGTALLESMVDRARMAVRFDDADPVGYDTASAEQPPKQFRDLCEQVGRPLARLKIAPNGKLLSLVRLGEERQAAETEDEQAAGSFDVADNVLVEFPDRALRIGDTWRQRFDVEVVVARQVKHPVTLQRTFELESVENGLATIGYRITIITAISDPRISTQLVQRTPSGRIVFDVEKGRIVSRSQSSDERVFGPFGPGSSVRAESSRTCRRRSAAMRRCGSWWRGRCR